MMKNSIILFVLAILSTSVLATDTVRLNRDIDLAVYGTTDTTFLLNSVESSGDGTSESAPDSVYVPMQSSSVADQADYFLAKGTNNTFDYLFDATDTSDVITFPLYLNVSTTDKYLYAAVKDGSTTPYKLAKAYGSVLRNLTNAAISFPVSPQHLCSRLTTDCSTGVFAPSSTGSTEKEDILVYFFLATDISIAPGADIDPTTYSGGIYFKVFMSNRIYPNLTITVTSARPGDKRAILVYSADSTILKPDHVRVFDSGTTPTAILPLGQLSGTLLTQEHEYIQNSEVTVTNLSNAQPYNLGVMFVDKYNFATRVSATQSVKPQEIEELLKKNSCFLLTAGFGEDHYVIDYFRHFRDTVLSQSYLGRAFISVYYETAPKYALMIYHNETIRAVIRGFAYTLYFIFNFYYVFIAGAAVIGAALVYRKRDKFRQTL